MADETGEKAGLVLATTEITPDHEHQLIKGFVDLVSDAKRKRKETLTGGHLLLAIASTGGAVDISRLYLESRWLEPGGQDPILTGFLNARLELNKNILFVSSDKAARATENLNSQPGTTAKLTEENGCQMIVVTEENGKGTSNFMVNLGFPDAETASRSGHPNPIRYANISVDGNPAGNLTGPNSQEWVLAKKVVDVIGPVGQIIGAINQAYSDQRRLVVWQSSNPSERMAYNEGNRVFRNDGEAIGRLNIQQTSKSD